MLGARRLMFTCGAAAGLAAAAAGPANALDEKSEERAQLKACERQICTMLVKKETAGPDFSCKIAKTWSKSKIEEGIKKKKLTWGFGDARCTVDVNAKRASLVGAVINGEHTLQFDPHTIKCEVERENSVTAINVTLAPKISFKGGKAHKAWVGLKAIEAPAVVKGALWTVAQVEDNFGLFHGDMISEINEFVAQKCPKAVASK